MSPKVLAGLMLLSIAAWAPHAQAQSTDTARPNVPGANAPPPLEELPDVPYGPGRPFRQACQLDYEQYCSGGEYPPMQFEAGCLRQSWVNLSQRCQQALNERASNADNGGGGENQDVPEDTQGDTAAPE